MIGRLRAALLARRADSDRGSVVLWVAVTTPALLLMLALVVDGGAKLKAAEQADTYAAEAARAATIAIGPAPTSGGTTAGRAKAAADSYLAAAGATGTVTITGPASVRVEVSVTHTGPISGASFTMKRTASATLLVGVETGQEL